MPEPYRLVAAVAFGMVNHLNPDWLKDNIPSLRAELQAHGLYLHFGMEVVWRKPTYGWRLHRGSAPARKSRAIAFGSLQGVCRHAVRLANPTHKEDTHET